jgi:hypothetical protein
MNQGRIIFSQLLDHFPKHEFDNCVARYAGNRRVRGFTCFDQFLSMAFAQLTGRESLRDIETCLRTMGTKLYHAGFRGKVSRSTLADANESRDWHIYGNLAQMLIATARRLYAEDDFGVQLETTAYALDSTTIDLCLALFPWAKFRKTKGAVKLHTLLDLRGSIPSVIIVTNGKVHDVNILDQLAFEPGAFYIMDRGYVDFARLRGIGQAGAFFVTRAKKKFNYRRRYSRTVDKTSGLRCDQTAMLSGVYSKRDYPEPLRLICFVDDETGKRFTFLTNNFVLDALTVAQLYRKRWRVELVVQVDQAPSSHQGLLRYVAQRRYDSDLDRHLGLCPRRHRQKTASAGAEPLYNSTDFEPRSFRENPHFTGSFATGLQTIRRDLQRTVGFIRLITGQQ